MRIEKQQLFNVWSRTADLLLDGCFLNTKNMVGSGVIRLGPYSAARCSSSTSSAGGSLGRAGCGADLWPVILRTYLTWFGFKGSPTMLAPGN